MLKVVIAVASALAGVLGAIHNY
ncbi:smalltalk protein [Bacteroides acidifaciens]|nr:smalltalk protein [Bacteroides acidifaciens]